MRSHWPVSILSIATSLINMALPLVLVRALSADDLGRFKIFFLYLMLFTPLTLISGVSNGLSYWAGNGERGLKAIRLSSGLFILLSILSFVALFIFREPLASRFSNIFGAPIMTVLFSAAAALGVASLFYDDAAIATGRIWTGAFFNAIFEIVRTGTVLAVAVTTHDLYWIVVAHVAIQGIKALAGYILGYWQGLARWVWDPEVFREVMRYALPVSAAALFGIGLNYSDQLILSRTISTAEFALYSVCCLTVQPLLVFEASVTRVLIPQLSAAFAASEARRAAALYRRSVQELAYFMIPAVAGMLVFASPVLELLFTHRYSAGAGYLEVYAFWYLTLIIPPDAVARARGESRWILGSFVAFSTLTIALCYALSLRYGPYGALSGLLAARFASRAYSIYYMKRTTGWMLADFLPISPLLKMLSLCTILSLLCEAARPLFLTERGWLACMGTLFATVYFALPFARRDSISSRDLPGSTRGVLMLTPGLEVGGLERMILNLSKSLKSSPGWDPKVMVYDAREAGARDLTPEFKASGIEVHSHRKPARFSLAMASRIAIQARRDGTAVIHTHDLGALIYGAIAKCLLRLGGAWRTRLIHTQHSFAYIQAGQGSWKYRWYGWFFARFADEIAVVSEDTRQSFLALGVPERKLHLVPNGVSFPNTPCLDPRPKRQGLTSIEEGSGGERYLNDFWILYLARVHEGKGQERALEIWKRIDPEMRSRMAMFFVGPATDPRALERLRREIAAAPDADRVMDVGPSKNPANWIAASDLFLSCSEFEGMPLAPIEACGSGVSTLLSRIPGHEFLAPTAELYPLEEPALAARALERAYRQAVKDSRAWRGELWARSEWIRGSFTLARMSQQYEALYDRSCVQLLGRQRA